MWCVSIDVWRGVCVKRGVCRVCMEMCVYVQRRVCRVWRGACGEVCGEVESEV